MPEASHFDMPYQHLYRALITEILNLAVLPIMDKSGEHMIHSWN